MIEKNGALLNTFGRIEIDKVQQGKDWLNDVTVEFKTIRDPNEDLEVEVRFNEHKGFEIEVNELKALASFKLNEDNYSYECAIDTLFFSAEINKGNEVDSPLNQVTVTNLDPKISAGSVKAFKNGEQINDEAVQKELLEFFVNKQKNALTQKLNELIEYAQKLMSNMKLRKELGILSYSLDFEFSDDFIEISAVTKMEMNEFTKSLFRDNSENLKLAKNEKGSVELLINENTLNYVLYSLFESEEHYGIRETFRVDDPENKYGSMISKTLQTQTLQNFWSQIVDEFGTDKDLDAQCNFGKSSNSNISKSIFPSTIKFSNANKLELSLGLGWKILVETNPNKWEEFRSAFVQLKSKINFEWIPNDLIKKINLSLIIDSIKIDKFKVMKQDEAKQSEEVAISVAANMGLEFLRKLVNKKTDKLEFKYLNFKKCTGLSLLKPEIRTFDGFAVVSMDFDIKAASVEWFSDYIKEKKKSIDKEHSKEKVKENHEIKEDL